MKKWKDECDKCHKYAYECHGYKGAILCPSCAKKLGFRKWEKGKYEVNIANEK